MIDTNTSIVLTGTLVALGRWATDKTISVDVVVGAGIAAVSLAVLAQANQQLANKFGVAIVLAALFTYLPSIVYRLGFKGSLHTADGKRVGQ